MSQTTRKALRDRTKKARIEEIWSRMASLRKQQMERINDQAASLAHQAQTIYTHERSILILRICFGVSFVGLIASIIWRTK